MIASVASFSSFSLMSGMTARAVPPAAAAPILPDRPQPSPIQPSGAIVALAPTAMSALLQVQEGLSRSGPKPFRARNGEKFDRRISRSTDEPVDEAKADEDLFATRGLPTALKTRS